MECKIQIWKLHDVGLTPTQYCYLMSIALETSFPWDIPEQQLEYLSTNKWLDLTGVGFTVTKKFRTFAKVDLENASIDNWIGEWRDLWPSGVYSSGRPVKGNKKNCLTKMAKFCKDYDYTKEEIFQATKEYIFKKEGENYHFMICADYFIDKNKVSTLASYCDVIRERGSELDPRNTFFEEI